MRKIESEILHFVQVRNQKQNEIAQDSRTLIVFRSHSFSIWSFSQQIPVLVHLYFLIIINCQHCTINKTNCEFWHIWSLRLQEEFLYYLPVAQFLDKPQSISWITVQVCFYCADYPWNYSFVLSSLKNCKIEFDCKFKDLMSCL